MRKKGFTLIEILISLSILSILAVMTLNFVIYNDRTYSKVGRSIDESFNARIGLEFLVYHIASSDDVKLVVKDSGGEHFVDSIFVSSINTSLPNVYLRTTYGTEVDKIYISKNILRNDTLSQQIATGVVSFSVLERANDLYEISLSTENITLSTIVQRKK